ncbi:hypothetical protein TrVFT333_004440 [Trichoderma virens FT-333]|nr:hypothetical protein TrVFT333_004440 [Trichoderma virens FT-333]
MQQSHPFGDSIITGQAPGLDSITPVPRSVFSSVRLPRSSSLIQPSHVLPSPTTTTAAIRATHTTTHTISPASIGNNSGNPLQQTHRDTVHPRQSQAAVNSVVASKQGRHHRSIAAARLSLPKPLVDLVRFVFLDIEAVVGAFHGSSAPAAVEALPHHPQRTDRSHFAASGRSETPTLAYSMRTESSMSMRHYESSHLRSMSPNPYANPATTTSEEQQRSGQAPRPKNPSQKAMLSRALQKANTAVQLDNAQNFEGAREAYSEACDLLQQVLDRTAGDEDKRKLEAIRQTYTSRIDELDQMGPWQDETVKALPARPESEDYSASIYMHQDYEMMEEAPRIETARIVSYIGGDSSPISGPPAHQWQQTTGYTTMDRLQPARNLEPGLLQSSFSRAPRRLRSTEDLRAQNQEAQYAVPPLSPRSQTPAKTSSDDMFAELPPHEPYQYQQHTQHHGHQRQPSDSVLSPYDQEILDGAQSSWLDPIDESGASTVSSVHSRTSSLGYRRRHIRAASGNTEAEFDTALDAAIEAAYDDGFEPMDPEDYETIDTSEDAMASVLQKVEKARERVRQTEQEAYDELANLRQAQQQNLQQLQEEDKYTPDGFYEDDSSEEEERLLEEITRDFAIEDFTMEQPPVATVSAKQQEAWNEDETQADFISGVRSFSALSQRPPIPNTTSAPAAPPPTSALPELPSAGSGSPSRGVRSRRLSGQNPKQLKIETANLGQAPRPIYDDDEISPSTQEPPTEALARTDSSQPARPPIPTEGYASESKAPGSPSAKKKLLEGEDAPNASPSIHRLRKNFSSSSLRSMKSRNMSVSHLDDNSDVSPGTPMNNPFGKAPAVPALPTPLITSFKENMEMAGGAGLHLFEDNFHVSATPGPQSPIVSVDVPLPLEPCPNDFMLRPFWLMRCLYQTLVHPKGGYVSTKLFVPRDVWRVKGVKIKNVEDKIANCDFLTAALLKLAKVDTLDADAVLEEMQSLEGVLEQIQSTLTRKLGSEVGVQGSGLLFKDASMDGDGGSNVPRSGSVSGKASAFSWRRLRPKTSGVGLGGSYSNRSASAEVKEVTTLPTIPMTPKPASRPAKRDVSQAQFIGPNANYMGSLARLFDAAQAVDQIARQVDDPGLRHADKTQVGLELCTRHAAEFFGFYVCRDIAGSPNASFVDAQMSLAGRAGRAWTREWLRNSSSHGFNASINTSRWSLFRGPYRSFASQAKPTPAQLEARIAAIPIERYRNFCIVAHIDHGKSTLSDRLLELTGTISASDANKQILDKLDVERERGITVKAQTCTMIYKHNGADYLLHLVDTPGHVDFRAEVTRSYASCGGALLLIDASQGIQAQTVSNFHLAFAQDLALVPVINKIDMPSADVPRVLDQMETSFELDPKKAVLVSAKTGKGVGALLPAVVEGIPHPVGDENKPLKMLLVDSWYDTFKGVVLLVRLFDGSIKTGDNVVSLGTGMKYTVGQVGIQYPNATPQTVLRAGQVGYVYFNPGMKRIQDAKLGDTFTTVGDEDAVEPCPGFEEPKPMVFVAAFPTDQSDYTRLADSINQLVLNDRSVTLQKDFSEALGSGWRLGFLGSLHCSVFQDRLRQEHGKSIIITEPTVPTKIVYADESEEIVQNPALFPDSSDHRIRAATLYEPYVKATITVPEEYLGRVIELCEGNRGEQKSLEFFHTDQVILSYDVPASQLVDDLFGKLKGVSKGYATLDYEDAGWRQSKLVKLQLLVNRQPVDAICRVVHSTQVDRLGRQWVTKFKEHVDRQMFEVVIQAVVGNKVIARETIKPFRKDVLAKLHASDITRRRKLLEKQKEGRKRLRAVGNVVIDQSAFQSFLSK